MVGKAMSDDLPALPIPFPGRREVEREIERTENPTGMLLNDSKERVILPGGTLRCMLRIIDAARPALDASESYWHKVADERAAEIVRLWEDAARYRLLRENACESYPSGEGSNNKDAYLVITGYDDLYPMTNEQKDAAVDEAFRITKEWNE